MKNFDARKETVDAIVRRISDLNEQSLGQLSQYISYLKWQEELWQSLLDEELEPESADQALLWQFDFIEGFPGARKAATRQADMMEIKVEPATCGMVQQQAIWQHPPTLGAAVCEYNLQVPASVTGIRMRFAVGIRDGALMEGDNLCAFRVYVNGMRIWSMTKQSHDWERYLIDLPSLSGQEMIVQFMTDGLGDNRWNWAVWGEPLLLGYGPAGHARPPMNLLTIEQLTKQFSERLLFDKANLLINEGDRIGLIGVNGSGKSTLLRIAAGLEAPDRGTVTSPGGVRIEHLAQEPALDDQRTVLETIFYSDSPQMQQLRAYQETSEALTRQPDDGVLQQKLMALSSDLDRTGGWAAEANAKAILTRLGVTDFDTVVGTLSGGQRKRVALARALIDRADLLVLDEPTNHIDADTVAWLEDYLAATPGALLMVTHDRYFLDRVVNRIVELDRRLLVSYAGNYTHYLHERQTRHERLAAAEQKRQKLLQRELAWLRRMPMARGTKQKARKQRVEELLDLQYDLGEDRVSMALASRRLGKQVLEARNLTKAFGATKVLDGVDLRLEPGDRLGIMGPNGAGKSTLLNLLAGKLTPDRGSVRWGDTVELGYYDQRSEFLNEDKRIIEFIQEEAPLILTKDGERVEAAQMLEWFLFPRPMQWARIGSLSGGERRRLYLLRTLVHRPNVLLLDEPTNDLDIQTLTVLEEFLDHFSGCLIVVSHDRYFLDRSVDHLLEMRNGRLGPRYPTPYATFLRLSREAAEPDERTAAVEQTPAKGRSSEPPTARTARKLSWQEGQELQALEDRIPELEARKAAMLDDMNRSGDDYLRLQSLAEQLEALDQDLETALERWLELSERAE